MWIRSIDLLHYIPNGSMKIQNHQKKHFQNYLYYFLPLLIGKLHVARLQFPPKAQLLIMSDKSSKLIFEALGSMTSMATEENTEVVIEEEKKAPLKKVITSKNEAV